MPRRRWTALGAVLTVGLAAGGWILVAGASDERHGAPSRPTATASVTRRDLVARDSFDGTLGYAGGRTVTGNIAGTVTWLPKEGAVVRRGERLYRVDSTVVRHLSGRVPAWRTMQDGVEGPDVAQLERNLAALGYTDGGELTIDGDYDGHTEGAVEAWEDDTGAGVDGVIELGEVVFLPGARRIGSHTVGIGDPVAAGNQIMETTSTRQVVTMDLEARDQQLAHQGDHVEVELPDGRTVGGRISAVGRVAQQAEDQDTEPTIAVTITIRGHAPRGLDQAPVEIGLAARVARDVLAVPVEALLALAEGGYALEVVEERGTHLVGVTTGLFADGWVEITGQGIIAGTQVVVSA